MKACGTILSLTALLFSFSSLANEKPVVKNVLDQLSGSLTEEAIQSAFVSNPDSVLDILTILLENNNVDPLFAISEAIKVAPDNLLEIADIAKAAGVSSEEITTAALLAGADPTEISEATAAGPAAAGPAPTIAPPAAPAIGSSGGGGGNVISPN